MSCKRIEWNGEGWSFLQQMKIENLSKIQEMEDEIDQEYGKCFVDMVGTDGQAKGSGEQEQAKDAEAKLKTS